MLLGARQFFERRGGGGWTNPYVTDGLVAMWDGEWNAGGGVHDPSATTWKDLVGTNDLDDIVSNNDDWDWTINGFRQQTGNTCRFRRLGTTISWLYAEIVVSIGTRDSRSLFGGGVNNGFANYARYFTATAQTTPVPYVVNSGTAMTVGYDAVAQRMYKNGALQTYHTVGAGNYGTTGEIYIGNTRGNLAVDPCVVYSLRLYSHALTAAEIAANYAIDKARFDMP